MENDLLNETTKLNKKARDEMFESFQSFVSTWKPLKAELEDAVKKSRSMRMALNSEIQSMRETLKQFESAFPERTRQSLASDISKLNEGLSTLKQLEDSGVLDLAAKLVRGAA